MVEPAFATLADDAYLHQAKELAQVGSAVYGVWQGCEEMFSKLTTPLAPGNSTTFCVAAPTDPSGLDDGNPTKTGPVGSFSGTLDDLTNAQIEELLGGELHSTKYLPKLTGVGVPFAWAIRGRNGNAIWLVPMLGVNANGDTVQNGTYVCDNYNSALKQIRKNNQIAWMAASGKVVRDVAGTGEIGHIPGVGRAIYKTAAALAARRAAKQAGKQLAPRVGDTIADGQRLMVAPARTATQLRNSRGVVSGGQGIADVTGQWLRGTHGNLGTMPGQVARALRGRSFRTFDDFREAFWKAAANDSVLSSQFSAANVSRMKKGLAPIAHSSQHHGKIRSFILHHRTPLQHGGGVYDLDNILIVTPKQHQIILDPSFHF